MACLELEEVHALHRLPTRSPCLVRFTSFLRKEAIEMIRKAHNLDPLATDPTPDDIRRRTEAIRKQWSPRERVRRSGLRRVTWTPPVFSESDLAGFSAEFETR